MTNPNLTWIVFLLDRSGSMQSIKTDTEGGFAMFTRSVRHECRTAFNADLKGLLLSGEHTYGSILQSLVGRGEDVLVVDQVLEDLFLNGLLMEDVDLRDAGVLSPGVGTRATAQPAAS